MNWLRINLTLQSEDIIEILVFVIQDSVTVILIIYIQSKINPHRPRVFKYYKSSANERRIRPHDKEVNHFILFLASSVGIRAHAYSDVSFHLCIDFIVQS